MQYELNNVYGYETYKRFDIFEIEDGKIPRPYVVDFTDQFSCTCNQGRVENNVPRGTRPILCCPHINFLWECLREKNLREIENILEWIGKRAATLDFMEKLRMVSELYKPVMRERTIQDSTEYRYFFRGELPVAGFPQFIVNAKSVGRYFVDIEGDPESYYVQEVRDREVWSTRLICSCRGSGAWSRTTKCWHIQAVELAIAEWVEKGIEYDSRAQYALPGDVSPPRYASGGSMMFSARYEDPRIPGARYYEDSEMPKEKKKKPPKPRNLFTEFEL